MLQIIIFQLSVLIYLAFHIQSRDLPARLENGGIGPRTNIRLLGAFVAAAFAAAAIAQGHQAAEALRGFGY